MTLTDRLNTHTTTLWQVDLVGGETDYWAENADRTFTKTGRRYLPAKQVTFDEHDFTVVTADNYIVRVPASAIRRVTSHEA